MAVRMLTTQQEWLEADRLIDAAFLHPWDEEKAKEKVRAQAEGTEPRPVRTWLTCREGTSGRSHGIERADELHAGGHLR